MGFDKLARQSANGLLAENEFTDKLLELSNETQESFLNFFEKPHQCLLFAKQDFHLSFEEKHIDIFCGLFSIDIKDNHSNLFYSQQNPLENKPIIRISDNQYLNVYQ